LLKDLKGVPDNIKALILSFDQTRDQYLREQRLLLIKLHNATTPEEREQIREQLQTNRQAFLDALKSFREQLRDDIQNLTQKISRAEFARIIELPATQPPMAITIGTLSERILLISCRLRQILTPQARRPERVAWFVLQVLLMLASSSAGAANTNDMSTEKLAAHSGNTSVLTESLLWTRTSRCARGRLQG